MYDTLGPNSVNYVLTHSEAKAVFVTAKKVGQLASALGSTNVTTVIAWGDADAADLAAIPSSIKSGVCKAPSSLSVSLPLSPLPRRSPSSLSVTLPLSPLRCSLAPTARPHTTTRISSL